MAAFPGLSSEPLPAPSPTGYLDSPVPSWTAGTLLLITGDWPLHYSGALLRVYTFVFSEVVLHSVGCEHEKVLFLFNHCFKPCSVR